MNTQEHLAKIRDAIELGKFSGQNEESIKQGIVLRILSLLGWDCYDVNKVFPEYSLGGKRVDYALLDKFEKPKVFIEAKALDKKLDDAEDQLFQYSYRQGVPIAILTNGKEWNFYLPTQNGDFKDRQFYKLDLLEQDIDICAEKLIRYLDYARTLDGNTFNDAKKDHIDKNKDKLILNTLPRAWRSLVDNQDEILTDLLCETVEKICGYKPEKNTVVDFLESITVRKDEIVPASIKKCRIMPNETSDGQTWIESIVQAFKNLDGKARLSELYDEVPKIRKKLNATYKSTIRGSIETFSSDSECYNGKKDLFKKLGYGYWGLR